jgi:hypothetical protein
VRKAFDILLLSNKENKEINSISEFLADFKTRQDIVVEQYTEILKFAKQWQNAKLLGEEKPKKSDKIKPALITNADGNKECVDINGYIADYVFSWAQCINIKNLNGRNNIFKALNEFIAPNKNY